MPRSRVIPAPLQPGSRVRVIAPSSPFDRALVLRGMGWLGERYRVEFDWSIFEREGFLAGSDGRRLDELNRALSDPGYRRGAAVQVPLREVSSAGMSAEELAAMPPQGRA